MKKDLLYLYLSLCIRKIIAIFYFKNETSMISKNIRKTLMLKCVESDLYIVKIDNEIIYNAIEMLIDIIYILFGISLIITFSIISFFFLIRAYQTKLHNLVYGGLGFFFELFGQMGRILFSFNIVTERIFLQLGLICIVIFTNITYYKGRKLLPLLIIGLTIFNTIVLLSLNYLEMVQNSPILWHSKFIFDAINRMVVFNWAALTAYLGYKEIHDQDIEPWIKARYKIVGIAIFVWSFHAIPSLFQPYNVRFGDPENLLSLVIYCINYTINISCSILFSIGWLMPDWFKKHYSNKYGYIEKKEENKEDLIEIIWFLGNKLSKKIDMSPAAARGMIKLAIQDELGPNKFIEKKLNYDVLKIVIQGSLKKRMMKLNPRNLEHLVQFLNVQLIKGQSLITMARA